MYERHMKDDSTRSENPKGEAGPAASDGNRER